MARINYSYMAFTPRKPEDRNAGRGWPGAPMRFPLCLSQDVTHTLILRTERWLSYLYFKQEKQETNRQAWSASFPSPYAWLELCYHSLLQGPLRNSFTIAPISIPDKVGRKESAHREGKGLCVVATGDLAPGLRMDADPRGLGLGGLHQDFHVRESPTFTCCFNTRPHTGCTNPSHSLTGGIPQR